MKIPLPILFALGTALCWGLYGPTLANARSPERLYSAFKPYVGRPKRLKTFVCMYCTCIALHNRYICVLIEL